MPGGAGVRPPVASVSISMNSDEAGDPGLRVAVVPGELDISGVGRVRRALADLEGGGGP